MKVAGFNKYFQFGKISNDKNTYELPIISPPLYSNIDVVSLLSYSTFGNHSVWIKKDGKAYAQGDNNDGRISPLIPKKILKKETEVFIQKESGSQYQFISAVCGIYYTLYLVSDSNDQKKLCYCYRDKEPLFLNLNGRNPKYLYGGRRISVAVDSEGGITIISKSVFDNPESELKTTSLPDGEEVIKISCLNDFIIAIGSSGRAFMSTYPKTGILQFNEIGELSGKTFVDVSGSFHHCLIVSNKGKVYGFGKNTYCILGMPKKIKEVEKFTKIKSLKKYKIVEVFAGYSHSLFKTDDGKIISCGWNYSGELMLSKKNNHSSAHHPSKTHISENVSFCIAGEFTTVLFLDCKVPPNMPNQKIVED